MEQCKMNFFTKIIKSISDIRSYVLFEKLTTGSAIFYLFLITLLLGTVQSIRPITTFNRVTNEFSNILRKESRDFSFVDGKLQVEGEMPIIFESDNNVVIIDTSGSTSISDLDRYESAVLFTEDAMFQKEYNGQINETNFELFQGFSFTRDRIESAIAKLKPVIIGFIIVFRLIGFFIGKLFTALLVAVVGLIMASIQNVKLSFNTLYRLSIFALTLPMIVAVTVKITALTIPGFYLIYCAGASAYLWFAIRAIKSEREVPAETGSLF